MSNAITEMLNAVKKMDYDSTVIIFMNPKTILKMDMKDYNSYVYFISMTELELGQAVILKEDSDLKRDMYEFVKEHPDRVWQGEKERW